MEIPSTSTAATAQPPLWLVVMGVAGCGKSTLAKALGQALQLPFIEGDQFHPPENVRKMSAGVALTDADREGWLDSLGQALCGNSGGAVLSCSALKRTYRQRLRAAVPGLRFVHLQVSPALADARVAARAAEHLFPPSLVASQFAALEDPQGEPGVLALDGALPPAELCAAALQWLQAGNPVQP
jgi:gluconokinase